MFTVTTTYKTNTKTGKGVITAKGRGKQSTVPYDHEFTPEVNHAKAAGVLANRVMSPVEQAKVWHPSGLQRITPDYGTPVSRFTIDV